MSHHGRNPFEGNDILRSISPSTGISLRDYFAAAAMQGWLASFSEESSHPADTSFGAQALAQQSYAIADAMMEKRDEQ